MKHSTSRRKLYVIARLLRRFVTPMTDFSDLRCEFMIWSALLWLKRSGFLPELRLPGRRGACPFFMGMMMLRGACQAQGFPGLVSVNHVTDGLLSGWSFQYRAYKKTEVSGLFFIFQCFFRDVVIEVDCFGSQALILWVSVNQARDALSIFEQFS